MSGIRVRSRCTPVGAVQRRRLDWEGERVTLSEPYSQLQVAPRMTFSVCGTST